MQKSKVCVRLSPFLRQSRESSSVSATTSPLLRHSSPGIPFSPIFAVSYTGLEADVKWTCFLAIIVQSSFLLSTGENF